ncbi:MAG: type II toxin-antitoxin system RelB/DinJ family antitoxin [Candidatus Magasanikbacteria bacterium]|nr:type II toxin-antitoxin system RelB/DinJ family antitoxin [Candidatus Magasanikbacteria bacterium]
MSSTVQLRVDKKTKQAVAGIFQSLGLDLSTGVKIFFQQVLRYKGIPFPLVTENGFTEEEEAEIIAESKRTMSAYRSGKLVAAKSWQEAKKQILVR